jgi:hypothetical protein
MDVNKTENSKITTAIIATGNGNGMYSSSC